MSDKEDFEEPVFTIKSIPLSELTITKEEKRTILEHMPELSPKLQKFAYIKQPVSFDTLEDIETEDMLAYVKSLGWKCEKGKNAHYCAPKKKPKYPTFAYSDTIIIPHNKEWADYGQRMMNCLQTICYVEKLTVKEILADLQKNLD